MLILIIKPYLMRLIMNFRVLVSWTSYKQENLLLTIHHYWKFLRSIPRFWMMRTIDNAWYSHSMALPINSQMQNSTYNIACYRLLDTLVLLDTELYIQKLRYTIYQLSCFYYLGLSPSKTFFLCSLMQLNSCFECNNCK